MILYQDKVTKHWIAEDAEHTAIAREKKEAFKLLLTILRIERDSIEVTGSLRK